jgi:hypothetical protein
MHSICFGLLTSKTAGEKWRHKIQVNTWSYPMPNLWSIMFNTDPLR